jgi:uncharacterized protein (DUF362 family)/ferredoxin-like protein FixX
MNSKVSIVKCDSYDPGPVFQSVKQAVDLLGGISGIVKPGSKVLVKPNLLMAKGPEFGVDTHPEVVRAVIKLLKQINCKIFVGDGPSVWGKYIANVEGVYELSGIKEVCESEGVNLVKFDKRRWRGKFPLTTWLDDVEFVVSLPKFKTHGLTLLTGAIKNLFGLVSGTYKTELHKNYFNKADFAKIVVDVFEAVKPGLTIVDGIIAMEGDGPGTGGKLRSSNVILAGNDCVSLDSVMALIMGLKPLDVLTTKEASERNLGIADINNISIMGERLENITGKPFILPAASPVSKNLPASVIKLASKLIKYYPCVELDNCLKCSACIRACPNKAVSMKNERIKFDYKKCIACFCCQEVCPASAIKTKKSLFAKMIGL